MGAFGLSGPKKSKNSDWNWGHQPTFCVISEAKILCFTGLIPGGTNKSTHDPMGIFLLFFFSLACQKTVGWTGSLYRLIGRHLQIWIGVIAAPFVSSRLLSSGVELVWCWCGTCVISCCCGSCGMSFCGGTCVMNCCRNKFWLLLSQSFWLPRVLCFLLVPSLIIAVILGETLAGYDIFKFMLIHL